jgi:hypothetical protein
MNWEVPFSKRHLSRLRPAADWVVPMRISHNKRYTNPLSGEELGLQSVGISKREMKRFRRDSEIVESRPTPVGERGRFTETNPVG